MDLGLDSDTLVLHIITVFEIATEANAAGIPAAFFVSAASHRTIR
jgi:hypothetical protein